MCEARLCCTAWASNLASLPSRQGSMRAEAEWINPEVQSVGCGSSGERNIPTCGQSGGVVADQGKFAELEETLQVTLEARRRVLGSADLKAKLARD